MNSLKSFYDAERREFIKSIDIKLSLLNEFKLSSAEEASLVEKVKSNPSFNSDSSLLQKIQEPRTWKGWAKWGAESLLNYEPAIQTYRLYESKGNISRYWDKRSEAMLPAWMKFIKTQSK